jgi:hypothetical protein
MPCARLEKALKGFSECVRDATKRIQIPAYRPASHNLMSKPRILIIEDEAAIAEGIAYRNTRGKGWES